MRDMTQGSIFKQLLGYAVPMVLGNMLQLTYNAVDSMIISKALGEDALAAVSTTTPIMTIMVLGASGMGIGASVLMSRMYGAKDMAGLKREFSTTVLSGAVFSLLVFLLGFGLSGQLLRWTSTPESVLGMAETYLRIVFVGFLFTFQYNLLSSAMRAVGDSKTPVMFLSLSCILNGLLDVLMVLVFRFGVAGAAWATTISEAVSACACMVWIRRRMPLLSLRRGEWQVDRPLLKETAQLGALTALQQAAQPLGKVLIQSVVNAQGISAIGAFNAASRIDDFARIPTQSIGSGVMTCTAQHRGAKKPERMRESLRKGLLIATLYYPIIFLLVWLLRQPAVQLLCPDGSTEMVTMGVSYLAVKGWFFIMPGFTNSVQGFFRGVARMRVVLISTIIQISIRTLFVYLLVPGMGIVGEAWGCFAGWLCMLIFEGTYYLVWKRRGGYDC